MTDTVRVWDLFVRVFHWSLVIVIFTALLTEDDLLTVHTIAGYIAGGLIVSRIIWGLVGPKHARFTDFVYSPKTVIAYIKGMASRRSQRYLGHSPAGGAMIIVLMILIALIVITGMAAYGAEENAGPLAAYFADSSRATRSLLGELHEILANMLWVAIIMHVGGVVFSSLAHRENLVRSMISGRKRME